MAENSYIFKKFKNNSYHNYTENLISVPYKPLIYFTDLEDKYTFPYSSSLIPEKIVQLLNGLLEYYNANEFKDEFISLLVFVQSMYLDFEESYTNSLIEEFIEEDKEFVNLLNTIEQYLFSNDNKLQAISFKFQLTDTKISAIKNSEIIDIILKWIY